MAKGSGNTRGITPKQIYANKISQEAIIEAQIANNKLLEPEKPNSSHTAADKIAQVLHDIENIGYSKVDYFSIGNIEGDMKRYADAHNITLGTGIYMSARQIAHSIRESKREKGLVISNEELKAFPRARGKMHLYYDKNDNAFIYTDGKAKYCVRPGYQIKLNRNKIKVVNYISAERIKNMDEFNLTKYEKIR